MNTIAESIHCKQSPISDLTQLWNLGVAGVPIPQYLRWADDIGIISLIADFEKIHITEIVSNTCLSKRGVEAILGILCSLKLVYREDDFFRLSDSAREYLDRRSPFYIGESLYGMLNAPFPLQLKNSMTGRRRSQPKGLILNWLKNRFKSTARRRLDSGTLERLREQNSRNYPAAVVAVNNNIFDGISHILDVGGGTGVFAIPLVSEYPKIQVTLVDLPKALPNINKFLEKAGNDRDRICAVGSDVFQTPWSFSGFDGALFGNFLHFCADDECLILVKESHRLLPAKGKIFIHEMLWNNNKDGPLVTALWNFWLTNTSAGCQRTKSEFFSLLSKAGFTELTVEQTCGGFSMIIGVKAN